MLGLNSTNARVRPPAVAGLFYPGEPAALRAMIGRLLARNRGAAAPAYAAKALIVPHAGLVYSGSVAASAYAQIAARRAQISRVVIIGPSHREYLRGIAVPTVDAFATPLGDIPLDLQGRDCLLRRGDGVAADSPHAQEHCIEVQLPFLQTVLDAFTLLPLLVGSASPAHVASVLDEVWGGAETLVLASSDLSHYHPYDVARQLDGQTAAAILDRQTNLTGEQACGAAPINGLLTRARQLGLVVEELDRLNSGDTSGDRSRVVGYGAYALHDA